MTSLEPGQPSRPGGEPGAEIPTLQPLPIYAETGPNPIMTPNGPETWARLTICTPQGSQTYFFPRHVAAELGKQLYELGTGGLILGGGAMPWTPPPP